MYLRPRHPIMSFKTIEFKMAAISVKRSIVFSPTRFLYLISVVWEGKHLFPLRNSC